VLSNGDRLGIFRPVDSIDQSISLQFDQLGRISSDLINLLGEKQYIWKQVRTLPKLSVSVWPCWRCGQLSHDRTVKVTFDRPIVDQWAVPHPLEKNCPLKRRTRPKNSWL